MSSISLPIDMDPSFGAAAFNAFQRRRISPECIAWLKRPMTGYRK
jgi:hypothetical protein